MAMSRADRTEQVDGLLTNLTSLRGVTGAAVVDRDGCAVHVQRDVDTEALAAATQRVFAAAQGAAQQVGQGEPSLVLSENTDGLLLLQPLANGFVLAILADHSTTLGALRYEVRESVALLGQLF